MKGLVLVSFIFNLGFGSKDKYGRILKRHCMLLLYLSQFPWYYPMCNIMFTQLYSSKFNNLCPERDQLSTLKRSFESRETFGHNRRVNFDPFSLFPNMVGMSQFWPEDQMVYY